MYTLRNAKNEIEKKDLKYYKKTRKVFLIRNTR